ncbi:MAG: hypothetical protein AB1492_07895 [Bacillota bacterium]
MRGGGETLSATAYRLSRLSPWVNFTVAVVLFIQRSYWGRVPGWFGVTTAVLAAGAVLAAQISTRYERKRWAGNRIQDLLEEVTLECHDRAPAAGTRCNVMLLRGDELRVHWHTRMRSQQERSLVWKLGQGCVGKACRRGEVVAEDLPAVSSYDQLRGDDDQAEWGLTLDHWQLTRDLRAVVSMPIRSPRYPRRVIGALNIDACVPLAESRIGDAALLDRFNISYIWLMAQYLVEYGVKEENHGTETGGA